MTAPQTTPQQQHTTHAALPAWFVWFQDHIGLSLLVLALMGINGIVYASGVVPNVQDPTSWGLLNTVLFALFFAAGAAMPGVALRAGAGIFAGEWYRRLACLLVSVMFFGLEVWTSITERSLNTQTSPADRWLLSLVGQPNLPFSPTVLVISLAISLVVVVWGLVTGVRARESEEDVAHTEMIKTLKARAKAERRAVQAAGFASAARAAFDAAKQVASSGETGDDTPDNETRESGALTAAIPDDSGAPTSDNDAAESSGKARTSRARGFGRKAVPSHMMSAPQFREYLRENGVRIPADKAVAYVQSVAGCERVGTMYAAPRRALMPIANRLIDRAQTSGNDATEDGALAG